MGATTKVEQWMRDAALDLRRAMNGDRRDYEINHDLAAEIIASHAPNDRTPTDYAIEHGEYLATAAEHFMDEQNKWDMAIAQGSDEDPDARSGAWLSLRSAIDEFRKRVPRSSDPPQACPGEDHRDNIKASEAAAKEQTNLELVNELRDYANKWGTAKGRELINKAALSIEALALRNELNEREIAALASHAPAE